MDAVVGDTGSSQNDGIVELVRRRALSRRSSIEAVANHTVTNDSRSDFAHFASIFFILPPTLTIQPARLIECRIIRTYS